MAERRICPAAQQCIQAAAGQIRRSGGLEREREHACPRQFRMRCGPGLDPW
jgi:hypothetical protein